jgi:hypothetical protein
MPRGIAASVRLWWTRSLRESVVVHHLIDFAQRGDDRRERADRHPQVQVDVALRQSQRQ